MKVYKLAKQRIIGILLLSFLLAGCLPSTTNEIPRGTMPQRPETYDDIIVCGPGGYSYRANCFSSTFTPIAIKRTEFFLSNVILGHPQVAYRDYIEAGSGQIRYNIIRVYSTGIVLSPLTYRLWLPLVKYYKRYYDLRLITKAADINITEVGIHHGPSYSHKQWHFMIEVPPSVKPGDYKIEFAILVNGICFGQIPCVVHVDE